MEITGKRCLVTGASGGIGSAIAKLLASTGYSVIGTSRDPSGIPQDQRIVGVEYLRLDLTNDQSIDNLINQIGGIDILINNAGMSQIGPVEEIPTDRMEYLFSLNFFGAVKLIRALVPGMRERQQGMIVNIGSMSARTPVPFSSIYAASKSALEAFSYGLQKEVMGYGIRVVVVVPGYIRTSILPEKYYTSDSPYHERVISVKAVRDRRIANAPRPEVVAEKILKIIRAPRSKPFYTVGVRSPLKAFMARILPV